MALLCWQVTIEGSTTQEGYTEKIDSLRICFDWCTKICFRLCEFLVVWFWQNLHLRPIKIRRMDYCMPRWISESLARIPLATGSIADWFLADWVCLTANLNPIDHEFSSTSEFWFRPIGWTTETNIFIEAVELMNGEFYRHFGLGSVANFLVNQPNPKTLTSPVSTLAHHL